MTHHYNPTENAIDAAERPIYQDYEISGYSVKIVVHPDQKRLKSYYETETKQKISNGNLHGFCKSAVPTGGAVKPVRNLQVHLAQPVEVAVLAHEITHAVHHAYWSRSRNRVFPSPHSDIGEKIATDIGELVGEIWHDLVTGGMAHHD